ncbi:MBL fold metallo-hydrolase [Clostridium tertium]|uniref:MBL fold metallo-hydrolase n=1 Tax=Clostridium tertium TaxID=1559 RepID=UPI00232C10B8|nr:MBL fold metallo-hydrolase [Clostridium tertium]MDB1921720.1 MBL fold metallo-hydrolase [Clostridium tertium]MDB1924923.1 MBL fold metallo-hydrolase [Clostridium tertium]MDB1929562.1 MBL fold metallo-hydrolase [Clostridium tertium]
MRKKIIKGIIMVFIGIIISIYYDIIIVNAINNNLNDNIDKGWVMSNGKWYFYDDNYKLKKGWICYNDEWYLLNGYTGEMSVGWIKINDKIYNLNSSGVMEVGWKFIDNNWYYFNSLGEMSTGWLNDDGKWYYLYNDGSMATGFIKDNGYSYYLDSSGEMERGWQLIEGQWYYFLQSGAMKFGWLYNSGMWYYLKNDGSMSKGWINDGVNNYYLDSSGVMRTGWLLDNNLWYYLNSSGMMVTGWLYSGDMWYLMSEEGKMLTGWVDFDRDRYFLNSSGAMETGWRYENGAWYYLELSGRMSNNQWKNIQGVKYWFNVDGKMATQDTIIKGKMYRFDLNGNYLGLTSMKDHLYVEVINTGDSECIYIELPNGDDVLIDGGESWNGKQIVEFLKTRNLVEEDGIEDIDYMINTHPHSDHIGGLADVLKSFKVNNLYYPFDIEMKKYEGFEGAESIENHGFLINCMNYCYQFYEKALKEAEKQGTKINDTISGEYIDSSKILKFVHPKKVYRQHNLDKDSSLITGYDYCQFNNDSAVIMLDYNNFKMLITGDIHVEAERDMVNMGLIPSNSIDVLKVSHHGYATSTSRELLESINFKYGIITRTKSTYDLNVNLGDVSKNFKDFNVKIFETWRENNIRIYVTDKTWNIEYN